MAGEFGSTGGEQTNDGADSRWSNLTAQLERELGEERSPADSLRDAVVSAEGDGAEAAAVRSAEAAKLVDELIAAGQEGEIGEVAYSLATRAINTGRDSAQQADYDRLSAATRDKLKGESHARYAAGYEQARQAHLAELKAA